MAVLSGSMEPTYHVGGLVFVQKVDPSDVEVGDSITFTIGNDTVVTHRVIEVNKEEQSFKTKGMLTIMKMAEALHLIMLREER